MIELKDKRTIDSKHYLNEDGTITAHLHSTPIHYLNENNTFSDIDLSIVKENNWEFEYALKKNNFRAYFNDSTDIENYILAGFELLNKEGKARWINFKMADSTPTGIDYKDNTFKYLSVFPNVDLEYIVTPLKLKENIIVHEASALKQFIFTIKLDEQLEMSMKDQVIRFFDKETREELWEVQAPFAVDAEDKRTDNVIYTLNHQEGEYYTLTVELKDEEFLANAVYPISIDPTVEFKTAAGDVRLYSDNPYVNGSTDAIFGVVRNSELSLIKFDLTSIPTTAVVSSGRMRLTKWSEYTVDSITLHEMTNPWTEGSVTYANYSFTGPLLGVFNIGYNGIQRAVINFDLTSSIQKWVADPSKNQGVLMQWNSGANIVYFFSKENVEVESRPRMEVTYEVPEPKLAKPTLKSPVGGESFNKVHPITWTPGEAYTAGINNTTTDNFENFPTPNPFGITNWLKITGYGRNGGNCLGNPYVSDWGSSTGTFSVAVPDGTIGTLEFYWYVSSERNYDWFTCKIDGIQEIRDSGSTSWAKFTKQLLPGNHTIEFIYSKDGSASSGSDRAFIDDLSFTITSPEKGKHKYQLQLSSDNGLNWKDMISSVATYTRSNISVVANNSLTNNQGSGRKIVRLTNGWIVTAIYDGASTLYYYVSKDNGASFSLLGFKTWASLITWSIASYGTRIFTLVDNTDQYMSFFSFDATDTTSNSVQVGSWPSWRTSNLGQNIDNVFRIQSNAIVVNGNEIHAAWSSYSPNYPSYNNIRYVKGTISLDGTVGFGAVEQVTTENKHVNNVSITTDKDGWPFITADRFDGDFSTYHLMALSKSNIGNNYSRGSGWYGKSITTPVSWAIIRPVVLFVPQSVNGLSQGRIWVTWQGKTGFSSGMEIYAAYSDDSGATWSGQSTLSSGVPGNYDSFSPQLTCDKSGHPTVVFFGTHSGSPTYNQIRVAKHNGNTWATFYDVTAFKNGVARSPMPLVDMSIEMAQPMMVYTEASTVAVRFHGTWTVTENYTDFLVDSYNYDFTDEPTTTKALVRLRAFDGISTYSDWEQSKAVFSIIHEIIIGTHKIQATSGTVIIPIYSLTNMSGKDQLRIRIGTQTGCFKLVPLNDPKASPWRTYTAKGTMAIAKQ